MYCAHFGLHRPPFNNTPDPAFYYGTSEHEEALATLEYATTQRKGFVLVTGEIGAGKTLIGRMFLRRVESRARTAIITHTHLNGRQLLAAICAEFELMVPPEASNVQLAEMLQTFLLEQFAQDRFVVVLLDEAQNLPDESFEAVRMLGNLEADDAKLLQICILGQPELRERFGQTSLRQLDQRLFRRFHLSTLSREQTAQYVTHRLTVAGWNGKELFTPSAFDRIHAFAGGTPRLINRICDNALLTVYGRHGTQVGAEVIDEVAGAPGATIQPTLPGEAGLHKTPRPVPRPGSGPRSTAEEPSKRGHLAVAQAELHAIAVQQVSGRLASNEETLRSLGREVSLQFQGLTEELKGLEGKSASAEDLEKVRSECRQSVQDVLKGLESQSSTLNELRCEIDRVLTAAAGGQQAPLEFLSERFENQVRELHQLFRDATLGRATVDDRLDALTVKILQNTEHLEVLGTQLIQQGQGIAHLEGTMSEQLGRVDRDLLSLRDQAVTREELIRAQAEQQALVGSIQEDRAATAAAWHEQQNATVSFLARKQEEAVTSLAERQAAAMEALRREQLEAMGALHSAGSQAVASLREEHTETVAGLRREQAATSESMRRQAAVLDSVKAGLEHHGQKVEDLGRRVELQLGGFEQELQHLRHDSATAQDVERWRDQHAHAVNDLNTRLNDESEALSRFCQAVEAQSATFSDQQGQMMETLRGHILQQARRLRDLRVKFAGWRDVVLERINDLARIIRERGQMIDDLDTRLSERERELLALDQRIVARFTEVDEALRAGADRAVSREEMSQLRDQHLAALADIVDRLSAQATTVEQLGERMNKEAATAADEKRAAFQTLSHRVSKQAARIRALQRKLLEWQENFERRLQGMDDRFANRRQFEDFQSAVSADSADTRERIDRHRRAMEDLINGVVERCRLVQEQIDAVSQTKADAGEVAQLSQRQGENAAELLSLLEAHKDTVREQLRTVLSQWERTQGELTRLTEAAAPAKELAALRQRQEQDTGHMLAALDGQRSELEALLAGVSRRCDEISTRLKSLPADIADAAELSALRLEHTEQLRIVCKRIEQGRSEFERALGELAERCRQLEQGVAALATRVASAEEVERLREDHVRDVNELVVRLDRQGSDHQREVSELNQRWQDLTRSVRSLAAIVPSTGSLEQLEEVITHNLSDLRQKLEGMQKHEREQVHTLMGSMQQLSARLAGVEQMDRPQPVVIELQPEAGRALAELNERAQLERERLEAAAERMELVRAASEEASRRIDESISRWQAGAADIDQRTLVMQRSATSAGELLNTMQRAQKVLDSKINSARWQEELARGEALTTRLESVIREGSAVCVRLHAALRDFDRCREEAEVWSARREEAQQMTHRLVGVLSKTQRAGERLQTELEGRKRVLSTLARNTAALANVIEDARRQDEPGSQRATTAPPPAGPELADWPKLHTTTGRLTARQPVGAPVNSTH